MTIYINKDEEEILLKMGERKGRNKKGCLDEENERMMRMNEEIRSMNLRFVFFKALFFFSFFFFVLNLNQSKSIN